ncbi:MAG: TIGR03960 family B12-binding radical SAM protein [Myxococcota bacterium]|jgi:radical SAM family uncharacterized protein/radical SAM-linked protein|nr:TIGR03960 family B12-binding radical SAM protein [Myxococcota bacterium]
MFAHPYASILHEVERPGRYVGGEFGAARPRESALANVVLAFPDLYEIGMSHMGLSVLYETVARSARFGVERAFMPWPDMEAALRRANLPLLALESSRPLREFDLVGFSLQYELTYTNVLAMLDLGRIPRRARDRRDGDPIVLVGGPLAMHCEPLAPAVDIAVLGDGEEALLQVLEVVASCKQSGHDRQATVAELSKLPFCAPLATLTTVFNSDSRRAVVQHDRPIATRAVVANLESAPCGLGPVPTVEAVFDRYSLEIGRGCACGCRFCQAGYMYRPVRERSEQACRSAVERAVCGLGFDEISLASLSTADHSGIAALLRGLGEDYTSRRVSFSVPSLRAYGLSEELVEVLGRLRRSGVTLAPEAGSQRLRNAINKNVTEKDLLGAAARFFAHGFHRIKLYFMIGLPGETDADLEAIVELGTKVQQVGRGILHRKKPEVAVSASTFVPKPFTPLSGEAMIDGAKIERCHDILHRLCRDKRLELKIHDPRLSILEGVLCRGDRSLFAALERAVDLGARFDGWTEQFKEKAWTEALREVDTATYLAAIPRGSRTPWDHLRAGVEARFLDREWERAQLGELTEPCGRVLAADGAERFVCHACGLDCKRSDVPLRNDKPTQAEALALRPAGPRPKGKPRPKVLAPQQGQDTRVLFWLAKWSRQAFVGHLDTQRHLMRALRRAALEVVYSQGFHPKPRMSSCPPLPMGMAALADPWEVHLLSPPPAEEITARLNRALPQDMEVVRAEIPPSGTPFLCRMVRAGRYAAVVAAQRSTVEAALSSLLLAPALPIERRKGGQTKIVDLRPFLLEARVKEIPAHELRLPASGEYTVAELTLDMPGSGGARVSELLALALGESFALSASVRTEVVLRPRCDNEGLS